MLLVLGGFLGGGRRPLAKEISRRYGFHLYQMRKHHLRRLTVQDQAFTERRVIPQNDEERLRVYKKTLEEFPMLSTMHRDIVIERTFHRKGPREYFLAEAAKYFSPVVFVWVEADDETALGNIQKMTGRRELWDIKSALAVRERDKREFEELPADTLRFRFGGISEDDAPRLKALADARLK